MMRLDWIFAIVVATFIMLLLSSFLIAVHVEYIVPYATNVIATVAETIFCVLILVVYYISLCLMLRKECTC